MNRGKRSLIDTMAITELLGLRTYRKGNRHAWTKDEDQRLSLRVQALYPAEYAAKTLKAEDVNWDEVARVFSEEARKAKDCRKRWSSLLDPSLRRGRWTPEEDRQLLVLYGKHGAMWQQVALEIEGRTEHQCLKRYLEVLDPQLRNRLKPWSNAEDLLLIAQMKKYGTKWKKVLEAFDGRPSLTCRNRWRNLVTAVARGRADPAVVEEMALVAGDFRARELDDDELEPAKPKLQELKEPLGTTTEWKFSLVGGPPPSGPLEQLLANGGRIDSSELVQALVQYAAQHSMAVDIHQHIHYHYAGEAPAKPEPESQITRFQHFNYLLPLAELPKLTLSPMDVDKPMTLEEEAAAKELDLLRLLNQADEREHAAKRQKTEGDEDVPLEEGLDFWDHIATDTRLGNSRTGSAPPVSQPHPLHFTPQPAELLEYGPYVDEERDAGLMDIASAFGAFPFNPL